MKLCCKVTVEDELIYEKMLKEVPPGMYFVTKSSVGPSKGTFIIVDGLYSCTAFEKDDVYRITNSVWGGWDNTFVRPARNVSIEVKGTY